MSSLSRELVFLILQFLDEEKFKETVHKWGLFHLNSVALLLLLLFWSSLLVLISFYHNNYLTNYYYYF